MLYESEVSAGKSGTRATCLQVIWMVSFETLGMNVVEREGKGSGTKPWGTTIYQGLVEEGDIINETGKSPTSKRKTGGVIL